MFHPLGPAILATTLFIVPVVGQNPGKPVTSPQARLLAAGWQALADGDLPRAAAIATEAVELEPRSAAAAGLMIEVAIAKSGATGGLDAYESWLPTSRVEAGYLLRRIGRAILWEVARQKGSAAGVEALSALAEDGDSEAAVELANADNGESLPELLAMASRGSSQAVETLIQRVQSAPAGKVRMIEALGESGNRRAQPVLLTFLSDTRDEHRAAAAAALGRLGGDVAGRLKPLLTDQNFTVRLRAAGALYRLEDPAGLLFLQQVANSEHAGVRLAAAEEMASRPDAAWLGAVRELTGNPDASVRLKAAGLIAPFEPHTARDALSSLTKDENPAVRDEAGRLLARSALLDFGALRQHLRAGDASQRVAAAARILQLTR